MSLTSLVAQEQSLTTAVVAEVSAQIRTLTVATNEKAQQIIVEAASASSTVVPLASTSTLPVITLQYASDVASELSAKTLVSTPVVSSAMQSPDNSTGRASLDPEDAELTSTGLQELPTLPERRDVIVSGSLAPQEPPRVQDPC